MTRLATFAAACVAVLTPALAPAAIELRFGQPELVPGVNRVAVDVFAVGTDDEDEQLWGYDLGFRLVPTGPSPQPPAVYFAAPYAERPADGFVFGDGPVDFSLAGNPAPSDSRFLINVATHANEDLPDVTGPVKIARVLVEASDPFAPFFYRYVLHFDQVLTVFGSGDPKRLDPVIEVDTSDQVWITPEPSAAGLMLAGVALALRRRRRRLGTAGKEA